MGQNLPVKFLEVDEVRRRAASGGVGASTGQSGCPSMAHWLPVHAGGRAAGEGAAGVQQQAGQQLGAGCGRAEHQGALEGRWALRGARRSASCSPHPDAHSHLLSLCNTWVSVGWAAAGGRRDGGRGAVGQAVRRLCGRGRRPDGPAAREPAQPRPRRQHGKGAQPRRQAQGEQRRATMREAPRRHGGPGSAAAHNEGQAGSPHRVSSHAACRR